MGKHYLQIGGSSMGTKAAPAYANCYMDKFERDFVYKYKLQPLLWKRYLDDCFCIWQHGEEELNKFFEFLNTRSHSIKFTMECSQTQVPFLDTLVKIVDNQIVSDLYCKPTDSHNYLLYSSAHPSSCKRSIPYSQFLRIRRICSDIKDFDKHAVDFAGYFLKRDYPLDLLETAVLKARRHNRLDLIQPKVAAEPEKQNTNILVTQYHPTDDTLKNIVQNNWDLLGKCIQTSNMFRSKPLTGYRRPKNLKDLLCRAEARTNKEILEAKKATTLTANQASDLSFPNNPLIGKKLSQPKIRDFFNQNFPPTSITTSASMCNLDPIRNNLPSHRTSNFSQSGNKNVCNNTNCTTCPFIDHNGVIISKVTGLVHHCKTNVTCHSSNLVYCIYCTRCGLQYVGQTLRELCQRLREHLLNIKHLYKQSRDNTYHPPTSFVPHSVGIHFSQPDHSGIKDVKIKVLEFIKPHPNSSKAKKLRLKFEKNWIHTLRTPAPQGLNWMD